MCGRSCKGDRDQRASRRAKPEQEEVSRVLKVDRGEWKWDADGDVKVESGSAIVKSSTHRMSVLD
jgi:hypothetical protein